MGGVGGCICGTCCCCCCCCCCDPVLWNDAFLLTLGDGLSDPASDDDDVFVCCDPLDSTDQVELMSRDLGLLVFILTRRSNVLTR